MNSRYEPPDMHKDTILIVDDTPTNIQILAHALIENYEIMTAAGGRAAINIINNTEKPDLILLDVMMPEMDGYEVCRELKSNPSTWDIPIVFVTAKGDTADQQRGFDLGAADYITKPFEIPLVKARIRVHLRLKQKTEMLERLALLDALTDIPNRRFLEDSFDRELRRAIRYKNQLSLLMIDVDHFKDYNDNYGHGAGDECLKKIAQTIKMSLLRPGDIAGRYGGEEFLVILPDCDQSGAVTVAENIRVKIEKSQIIHAHSSVADHVTISVGVASGVCTEEESWENMVRKADEALYRAKNGGRNRVSM